MRFKNVIQKIDVVNSEDPNLELFNGEKIPEALLYGQRMSDMLEEVDANAGELLKIAAQGQHIKRWSVPRNSYPMDRKGYLQWRTKLKTIHAELLADIMVENGYSTSEADRVGDLILKKKLKTDPESQLLEDVVCLVFLKHYFDRFIEKHKNEEEKLVSIVQKTWRKMSEKGHKFALAQDHSTQATGIIQKALA